MVCVWQCGLSALLGMLRGTVSLAGKQERPWSTQLTQVWQDAQAQQPSREQARSYEPAYVSLKNSGVNQLSSEALCSPRLCKEHLPTLMASPLCLLSATVMHAATCTHVCNPTPQHAYFLWLNPLSLGNIHERPTPLIGT